jgi:hypothetical protein
MGRGRNTVTVGLFAILLLTSPASAAQAPTTEDFVKTVAVCDMSGLVNLIRAAKEDHEEAQLV